MGPNHLLEDLRWRGLVYHVTDGLAELLTRDPVTAYIGFDPTAPSLHVGHLLQVIALTRLQRFGHCPIALVGGGTGMIGDPSGRSQERVLLEPERLEENARGIHEQLSRFLDFGSGVNQARIVDNHDWLDNVTLLTFLRETGKHFTVSSLLQKEAVSRRLESKEGISFTEFSYPLLQAYDFMQLFDRYGCVLQLGGSDQWGNITAGIDLIRRVRGQRAHGLVMPLIKTASGTKFGKTEAGAVWLDAARTSPFRFYQFWLNTEDRDVGAYLRYFTFLDRAAIEDLEAVTAGAPQEREAQRALARDLTALVHGADQAGRAERASGLLFGEAIDALAATDVLAVLEDVPSTELASDAFEGAGVGVVDLVARVGLAASKAEARRLVQAGGVYVNSRRCGDWQRRLSRQDAIEGVLFVLRRGQRQNHVVRLVDGGRIDGLGKSRYGKGLGRSGE